MSPAPTIRFRLFLAGLSGVRKVSALCVAMGLAPKAMAWFRIALPSVPFNPTAPPMPATGLTINPTVFVGKSFQSSSWITMPSNKLQINKNKKEEKKVNLRNLVCFAADVFLVNFV